MHFSQRAYRSYAVRTFAVRARKKAITIRCRWRRVYLGIKRIPRPEDAAKVKMVLKRYVTRAGRESLPIRPICHSDFNRNRNRKISSRPVFSDVFEDPKLKFGQSTIGQQSVKMHRLRRHYIRISAAPKTDTFKYRKATPIHSSMNHITCPSKIKMVPERYTEIISLFLSRLGWCQKFHSPFLFLVDGLFGSLCHIVVFFKACYIMPRVVCFYLNRIRMERMYARMEGRQVFFLLTILS